MAKILVADDNSNIQKMVGLALKDQGIEVVAVGNGEAAVRKISDLRPDLVLADVFMPVRSGYEVCSYVKQDPSLAHIPVILLVGAFDPLDEQEAQRVGADGVLKKPFVPPDPLISMVKSALARAGVALGAPKVAEKAPEPATRRSAAELLSPAASKLAELAPPKFPEPEPEPEMAPEDLPSFVTEVRIEAGQEPLAFGSLLDTPEAEDDAAFIPAKPPTDLGAARNWSENEPEEEEEETEAGKFGHGWRPGGDLDAKIPEPEVASSPAPDWREEAFHGNSPAQPHRSQRWAPAAVAEPSFAEAGARASAVTTLEKPEPVQPAEVPAFSGDAWAAAMAAGVEEKLAETNGAPKNEDAAVAEAPAEHAPETAVEAAALPEIAQGTATLPESTLGTACETERSSASNACSDAATPWELEAKKATLLASTWDHLATHSAPDAPASDERSSAVPETADVADAVQAPPEEVLPAYLGVSDIVQDNLEHATESIVEESAYARLTELETAAPEVAKSQPSVNETQEIEPYQVPQTNQPESSWLSATPETVHQFVETPALEFVPEQTGSDAAPPEPTPEPTPEPASGPIPIEQSSVEASDKVATFSAQAVAEEAQPPNMDDLVARVLARMNPDILQKVTREILKPVIEAIVQDEINAKKL